VRQPTYRPGHVVGEVVPPTSLFPSFSQNRRRIRERMFCMQFYKAEQIIAFRRIVINRFPIYAFRGADNRFYRFFSVLKSGMDALMSLTDKFTKWIKLVPEKITYSAWDWAVVYYDHVYSQFRLPAVIISDRDVKFISNF
jgi:hypothetical protein